MKKPKPNPNQLSMFDFDELAKSEERLVKRLNEILKLEDTTNSPKEMLKVILATAERELSKFDKISRCFIRDCALLVYRNNTFSEKQLKWLRTLYVRAEA